METADGVAVATVVRRNRWRGVLIGVGVAFGAALLAVLSPQPAHADDGRGLVGSLLGGVAATVADVVEPVTAPLPELRELPLVGELVGTVADSAPVTAVTQPVTRIADGLLGDTVGALPVVGGLLGDTPVGSVLTPVADIVDGTLADIAGPASDPGPAAEAAPVADAEAASVPPLPSAALGLATGLLLDSRVADQFGTIAVGAEGPLHGPVSVPGDVSPTSAVTAGGPPIGLAAAVLGAGLLLLLARGRVRPAGFRAPPSPVYATDTSPD